MYLNMINGSFSQLHEMDGTVSTCSWALWILGWGRGVGHPAAFMAGRSVIRNCLPSDYVHTFSDYIRGVCLVVSLQQIMLHIVIFLTDRPSGNKASISGFDKASFRGSLSAKNRPVQVQLDPTNSCGAFAAGILSNRDITEPFAIFMPNPAV